MARLWPLSWAKSISVSFSHPCLSHPKWLLPFRLPIEILHAFLNSHITFPPISSLFVFHHIDINSYYSYLEKSAAAHPVNNILWNSKIYCRVHISSHWHIQSQFNPVNTLESCFLMIRHIIILKASSLQVSRPKLWMLVAVFSLCYMSRPSYLRRFDRSYSRPIWSGVQIMSESTVGTVQQLFTDCKRASVSVEKKVFTAFSVTLA